MLEKPERIRDDRHLRHVQKQTCLCDVSRTAAGQRIQGNRVCDPETVVPHHLTFVQPKARGLKSGDQWTVPLCFKHHTALHAMGDESLYWALAGIDAKAVAERLWDETMAFREKREIKLDYQPKPLKTRKSGSRLIG